MVREKSVCAGADISELRGNASVDGNEFSISGKALRICHLKTMGQPSICAINGFARRGCERRYVARFESPAERETRTDGSEN